MTGQKNCQEIQFTRDDEILELDMEARWQSRGRPDYTLSNQPQKQPQMFLGRLRFSAGSI